MKKYDPSDYPTQLVRATNLTNAAILEVYGSPGGCILGAYALNEVLHRLGLKPKIVRVEVHIFPHKGNLGTSLGGRGDGTRREAAGKGMWNGHLAVLVDDKWILDPTLDQLNTQGIVNVPPMVVEINDKDYYGKPCSWNEYNDQTVRYHIYHKQVGFKDAPDARASHWRPVAELVWKRIQEESYAV